MLRKRAAAAGGLNTPMCYGRRLNVLGQHFASQVVPFRVRLCNPSRHSLSSRLHFSRTRADPGQGLCIQQNNAYTKCVRTETKKFAGAMTISAPSVLFPLIYLDLIKIHPCIDQRHSRRARPERLLKLALNCQKQWIFAGTRCYLSVNSRIL